jgi:hypothetical protein
MAVKITAGGDFILLDDMDGMKQKYRGKSAESMVRAIYALPWVKRSTPTGPHLRKIVEMWNAQRRTAVRDKKSLDFR